MTVEYGQEIKYGPGVLEATIPIRTERYKGKGRPRKNDYDYKTANEWMMDMCLLHSRCIDEAVKQMV